MERSEGVDQAFSTSSRAGRQTSLAGALTLAVFALADQTVDNQKDDDGTSDPQQYEVRCIEVDSENSHDSYCIP